MFFLLKPKFKNVEEIIDLNEFSNEANLELFKEVFHKNHFNNPLPIGDNFNYKKFIIVATQRTGTSLLVNLLRSHSSVVCYSELLKENDRPAWGFKRIDSVTYKLSKKFPLEFLNHFFYRNYSDKVKAVGFKFMYNQLTFSKAKKIIKSFDNKKDVIIHLKRKNKLKTYVSQQLLKINKKPTGFLNEKYLEKFKNNKSKILIESVFVSANEFKSYVKRIQKSESKYDKLISSKNHIIIYYEDLEENYIYEANKIINAFELPEEDLICLNVKINNNSLAKSITNYTELKKEFRFTEYEIFFDV